MKFIKTYVFILFAVMFVFASCKKEEVNTTDKEKVTVNVVGVPVGDGDGGVDPGDGGVDPGDEAAVLIYGASWCSACTFLKGQLDDEEIEYTEKDVDDSDVSSECYSLIIEAGYTIDGSYSIPVAKVGDNPVLYGADCTLENILDQL